MVNFKKVVSMVVIFSLALCSCSSNNGGSGVDGEVVPGHDPLRHEQDVVQNPETEDRRIEVNWSVDRRKLETVSTVKEGEGRDVDELCLNGNCKYDDKSNILVYTHPAFGYRENYVKVEIKDVAGKTLCFGSEQVCLCPESEDKNFCENNYSRYDLGCKAGKEGCPSIKFECDELQAESKKCRPISVHATSESEMERFTCLHKYHQYGDNKYEEVAKIYDSIQSEDNKCAALEAEMERRKEIEAERNNIVNRICSIYSSSNCEKEEDPEMKALIYKILYSPYNAKPMTMRKALSEAGEIGKRIKEKKIGAFKQDKAKKAQANKISKEETIVGGIRDAIEEICFTDDVKKPEQCSNVREFQNNIVGEYNKFVQNQSKRKEALDEAAKKLDACEGKCTTEHSVVDTEKKNLDKAKEDKYDYLIKNGLGILAEHIREQNGERRKSDYLGRIGDEVSSVWDFLVDGVDLAVDWMFSRIGEKRGNIVFLLDKLKKEEALVSALENKKAEKNKKTEEEMKEAMLARQIEYIKNDKAVLDELTKLVKTESESCQDVVPDKLLEKGTTDLSSQQQQCDKAKMELDTFINNNIDKSDIGKKLEKASEQLNVCYEKNSSFRDKNNYHRNGVCASERRDVNMHAQNYKYLLSEIDKYVPGLLEEAKKRELESLVNSTTSVVNSTKESAIGLISWFAGKLGGDAERWKHMDGIGLGFLRWVTGEVAGDVAQKMIEGHEESGPSAFFPLWISGAVSELASPTGVILGATGIALGVATSSIFLVPVGVIAGGIILISGWHAGDAAWNNSNISAIYLAKGIAGYGYIDGLLFSVIGGPFLRSILVKLVNRNGAGNVAGAGANGNGNAQDNQNNNNAGAGADGNVPNAHGQQPKARWWNWNNWFGRTQQQHNARQAADAALAADNADDGFVKWESKYNLEGKALDAVADLFAEE